MVINTLVFSLQVIRLGFEPRTHSLEGCCSIQLSYPTILLNCDAKVGDIFYYSKCFGNFFQRKIDFYSLCTRIYHQHLIYQNIADISPITFFSLKTKKRDCKRSFRIAISQYFLQQSQKMAQNTSKNYKAPTSFKAAFVLCTASALLSNNAFSSAFNSNSTIFSIPFLPKITGTPMHKSE